MQYAALTVTTLWPVCPSPRLPRHLQMKMLQEQVVGLQAAVEYAGGTELAAARTRASQLEATLRARDKELEKLKTVRVRGGAVDHIRTATVSVPV